MVRGARSQEGFTLAEMVTVVAIIGILAGLVLSALSEAVARAERVACMANLRQIGKAMEMYTSDWYGRYPPLNGTLTVSNVSDNPWHFLLHRYGIDGKALHCPVDDGFDPDRYPGDARLVERLAYRSHSISYGLQYDWKDADGNVYRANPTGGWESGEPDGKGDAVSIADWQRRGETILAADSDGDGSRDYAIDLTGMHPIGGRHDGFANVLFTDGRVEAWQVMPEKGVDINNQYRYWTVAND